MIEATRSAFTNVICPDHIRLDDQDRPFFSSVLAEFANAEWTNHKLELAAMLARTMTDLHNEQIALRKEGSVVTTERGTQVTNPRKTVIQMYAGTVLSFRRSLALNARAREDRRDTAARRKAIKQAEDGINGLDDDEDLIARPN